MTAHIAATAPVDAYVTVGGVRVARRQEQADYHTAIDRMTDDLDSRMGAVLSSNYEYPGRYTRWDTGIIDPPVMISARKRQMRIEALNARGIHFNTRWGNDIPHGSSGNDTLEGRGGNDSLLGAEGADVIVYGAGDVGLMGAVARAAVVVEPRARPAQQGQHGRAPRGRRRVLGDHHLGSAHACLGESERQGTSSLDRGHVAENDGHHASC